MESNVSRAGRMMDWVGDNRQVIVPVCVVVAVGALIYLGYYFVSQGLEQQASQLVDSGYYVDAETGKVIPFSHLEVSTGDMSKAGMSKIMGAVAIGSAVGLLYWSVIGVCEDPEGQRLVAGMLIIPLLMGIIWTPLGTVDYFDQISDGPTLFTMDGKSLGWSQERSWNAAGDFIRPLQMDLGLVGYGFLAAVTAPLLVAVVLSIVGVVVGSVLCGVGWIGGMAADKYQQAQADRTRRQAEEAESRREQRVIDARIADDRHLVNRLKNFLSKWNNNEEI